MTSIEKIKDVIASFEGITWCSCGGSTPHKEDSSRNDPGWVKFGIEKSELGWRLLEFLGWATTDMIRAGERLKLFPTSPPPYLNEPGNCLSFVIEIFPKDGDQETRFTKVAEFLNRCRLDYWADCKPKDNEAEPTAAASPPLGR